MIWWRLILISIYTSLLPLCQQAGNSGADLISCLNDWETQERTGKASFSRKLKSETFHGGACRRHPSKIRHSLRKSFSIYHRSAPGNYLSCKDKHAKKYRELLKITYTIIQPVLQKRGYSSFSSFEVVHKTPNSDFGGSVGLKLHNKALNSDYYRAFI